MVSVFCASIFAATYTVAGSSEVAFGSTWKPENTANDMTLVDGVYTLVKEDVILPAGTVEYKVCKDHGWATCWPAGPNAQLAITETGKYTLTFTFVEATGAVNASANKTEDAQVDPTVSVKGAWDEWAAEVKFLLAEDKKYASATKELDPATYEFKAILNDGDWRSNGATFTREAASVAGIDGNSNANMKLVADAKGNYTFTWTFASNTLAVTFPEKGDDPIVPPTPVDSITVYFVNNLSWETVNAFVWPAEGASYKDWPGEAAKKEAEQINEKDVYSYTFPASYVNVIFNNGSAQTVDLIWDAAKPYFVPGEVVEGKYTGTWYAKADIPTGGDPVVPPTPEGPVYSVAGSKALLGAEWNEKEGNEMTLDTEDGLYKLFCADVTLAAGTEYKFKIVTNHNWNNPNYPAQDKVLTVEEDGKYDVTITFNAETKEVAYVAEFKGGVIVEKHYLIVGDAAIANGEDWNNDADVNLMTSADEGLTYTLVIPNVKMIANKEYGYKVVEKGSWTEYFPNKVGGGNEYFSVTESAVYTLTYTFTVATPQCVVLAFKTGELPEPKLKDGFYLAGSFAGVDAWTIDDLNENKFFKYVEGDETYALYTLTANLAVGDKFKVVSVAQDVIMNWLPDGQGNEIVVTANYAGEAKVINLYFDYKEGRFSIWIEPNMQNGFYLVGSMNNWTPAKEYLFAQNPDNTAEYVLSTTLAENDQFKVVYVYEGEIQNDQWYPAAENSDYTVDATHAGKKDIYFRPDYQGGEDWYYGCIYVAANEPTGIEETIAAGKAAKVLRNGQIFILKGDKMYNVMGAVIR